MVNYLKFEFLQFKFTRRLLFKLSITNGEYYKYHIKTHGIYFWSESLRKENLISSETHTNRKSYTQNYGRY